MPDYFVSTLGSARWNRGLVRLDNLQTELVARWPKVQVQPATHPDEPWRLTWTMHIGESGVTGRVFYDFFGLLVRGEQVLALEVVAWYLGIAFTPQLLGTPKQLCLTEIDGALRRTIIVGPGATAQDLQPALANKKLRRPPPAPPQQWRISTVHTGSFREGALEPGTFTQYLGAQWGDEQSQPTTDPHNPWTLTWQARVDEVLLSGRLGRTLNQVEFTGEPAGCLRFACWYRTLVSPEHSLALDDGVGTMWVDLSLHVTPAMLADAFAYMPKRADREARRYRLPHRVLAPGGHLGQIAPSPDGAPYASVALHVTPAGDVWLTDLSRLLLFRDETWHVLDPFPYAPLVGDFVRFRDQLWAHGYDGLLAFDGQRWARVGANTPLRHIHALAVDGDGTLWALTAEASLWRTTDGLHWQAEPLPASSSTTGKLLVTTDGILWALAWDGRAVTLFARRNGSWEPMAGPPLRRGSWISGLVLAPDGTLWLGVQWGGLWHRVNECWERVNVFVDGERIPGGSVGGLAIDGRGRLWVAHGQDFAVYSAAGWQRVSLMPEAPSIEGIVPIAFTSGAGLRAALQLDQHGRLWVATDDRQVAWVDTTQDVLDATAQLTLRPYEPTQVHPTPLAMGTAPLQREARLGPPVAQGVPLVPEVLPTTPSNTPPKRTTSVQPSPRELALHLVSGGVLGRLVVGASLPGIWALAASPGETLWASTGQGQLVAIEHERWREIALPEQQLINGCCWYRGRVWVVGGRGVASYDGTRWQSLPADDFFGANPWSLCVDSADVLWVGTAGQGLWRSTDGASWERLTPPGAPEFLGPVRSDGQGTVWCTALGKRPAGAPLWRWRNGAWDTFALPSRRTDLVLALASDAPDQLWAALGSGLWQLRGGAWERVRASRSASSPGLPSGVVSHLFVDRRGRTWAITSAGIAIHDGGAWKRVGLAINSSGTQPQVWMLPDDALVQASLDARGRLWIGTLDGTIAWLDTTGDLNEFTASQSFEPYRASTTPTLASAEPSAEPYPHRPSACGPEDGAS